MTNHRQNHPSWHAKPGLKHGKFAVFSLENDKRHTSARRSNTFLSPEIARKWRKIYASRPESGGNVRHDGQSGRQIGGAGKGLLSGLVEALCRDFRQHDEEELTKMGARTLYPDVPDVDLAVRICRG